MKTILSESSNPDEWFHVIALIEAVRHAKLNTPRFCLITFRVNLLTVHNRELERSIQEYCMPQ